MYFFFNSGFLFRGQVSSRSDMLSARSATAGDGKPEDSMSTIREMLKVAQEKRHNERIVRIIDAAAAYAAHNRASAFFSLMQRWLDGLK